ncbi:MAG: alpha/beta fold hydrolase [Candidatus Methanomethylophilaceae archaeon]
MFAELNGARICYEVQGEGDPVLLIAGFGANRKFWRDLVPLLEGHTVVTLDNRGVGETVYSDGFTVNDMADDAVALMSMLGFDRFHVIGWSMGSLIVQSMLLRHRECLKDAILMSTYIDRPARSSYVLGEFTRMVNDGTATMESFCVMVNAFVFSEGVFKGLEDKGLTMPIPRRPERPEGLRDQLKAVYEFYPGQTLSQITTPVLVIQGTEDIMTPFHHGEVVRDTIPGAELFAAEGAGHTIGPDSYYRTALEFFSRHPE